MPLFGKAFNNSLLCSWAIYAFFTFISLTTKLHSHNCIYKGKQSLVLIKFATSWDYSLTCDPLWISDGILCLPKVTNILCFVRLEWCIKCHYQFFLCHLIIRSNYVNFLSEKSIQTFYFPKKVIRCHYHCYPEIGSALAFCVWQQLFC